MRNLLLIIHQLGFVLGIGAATLSDVLFLKSIKEPSFFLRARKFFPKISKVIFLAFFLLLLSGVFLFIPKAASLGKLPTFQAKLLIVSIIGINGLFLNFVISPRLKKFESITELKSFKTPILVSGVVSIVSWYTALFLGFFKLQALSLYEIFFVYFFLIFVGVILSHLLVNFYLRQSIYD